MDQERPKTLAASGGVMMRPAILVGAAILAVGIGLGACGTSGTTVSRTVHEPSGTVTIHVHMPCKTTQAHNFDCPSTTTERPTKAAPTTTTTPSSLSQTVDVGTGPHELAMTLEPIKRSTSTPADSACPAAGTALAVVTIAQRNIGTTAITATMEPTVTITTAAGRGSFTTSGPCSTALTDVYTRCSTTPPAGTAPCIAPTTPTTCGAGSCVAAGDPTIYLPVGASVRTTFIIELPAAVKWSSVTAGPLTGLLLGTASPPTARWSAP